MTIRNNLGILTVGSIIGLTGSMAAAATIHTGNNSHAGSLCVGFDCVASESFGSDTLRLKENNLRLHFDDTSSAASFPGNDWRFIANDSTNGGDNYMAIEDSTAGRLVFRVDAGAPANSLRVDSSGDVGIGVANPVTDLHIATGNTPTMRLEQNGTSGFAPQSFDVAANETNFFIRDVTNGSTLPFRVRPGAPTSAIDVNASGNVGIGTANPQAELDVFNSGNDTIILLSNTAGSSTNNFELKNTQASGRFSIGTQGGTTPLKIDNGSNTNLMRLGATAADVVDIQGNLVLTGTITTGGSCSIGCDRVFDPDYDLSSIEEHSAAMWSNGYLPNVGATAETGQYDLSNKVLRMLNELEHAHIYIAQMHERIATLEKKLEP
jgi:hypothetical protein